MFLFVIIVLLIALYLYSTKNHDYWTKRKIKHDRTLPLFGTHHRTYFGFMSIADSCTELYNRYPDEEVIGYFQGRLPTLIVRDLDIVKHILTIDSAHFYKRGLGRDYKNEPLLENLFHVDDDRWKLLRQRLTAAFTTSKLKNMFPLIVNCAEKLKGLGEEIVSRGGECDARDLMARFTTDFIGACGFGIEMNTINQERSFFRELGKKMFQVTYRQLVLLAIYEVFPETRKYIYVGKKEIENDLIELVTKLCEQRNYKPVGRNDFLDLLLELRAKGKLEGESVSKTKPDGTPEIVSMEMDIKCMTAQIFVFFAAGFETSSSATSFTLHMLAYHPDIQEKVQAEIDKVLLKYDNKLCYDSISEMQLLDMAFKEAMRLWPSLGVLNRICTKKYTLPKIGVTIDPGVKIIIPLKAIHTDEKHFENPKEFKPERFNPEVVKTRNKFSYLPFGEGPRVCIGARLGQMQSLAGLAAVLSKFTVEPSALTRRELVADPKCNVVQAVLGGVPLKLKLRKPK